MGSSQGPSSGAGAVASNAILAMRSCLFCRCDPCLALDLTVQADSGRSAVVGKAIEDLELEAPQRRERDEPGQPEPRVASEHPALVTVEPMVRLVPEQRHPQRRRIAPELIAAGGAFATSPSM